jgi:outer membrane protein W
MHAGEEFIMRRSMLALLVLVASVAGPANASAQQAFNMYLGGFVPRGEDSRTNGDVLVSNLDFLSFNLSDFNAATVGGEWLFPLSDRLDAGLGLGVHSRGVPAVYTELTHAGGAEIEQDLKLRIVPFTATVRFLPLGRDAAVQPYIGAGVGIFGWRYTETGEFVDFSDRSIFRDRFEGSGATAGPVVMGGVTFPIGSWSIGGEIRYESAQGELPEDQFFSGPEVDLGGFNYLATFKVRF